MYDQYRFPYQRVSGRPSPVVTVRLFRDKGQADVDAYVDSGAFYSVFQPYVAQRLGIDIETGLRRGVILGDGRLITIYLHRVGLRLGDEHLSATIGFSRELGIGFNLLGRYSIFDKLMFCFNDHQRTLYVSRITR